MGVYVLGANGSPAKRHVVLAHGCNPRVFLPRRIRPCSRIDVVSTLRPRDRGDCRGEDFLDLYMAGRTGEFFHRENTQLCAL